MPPHTSSAKAERIICDAAQMTTNDENIQEPKTLATGISVPIKPLQIPKCQQVPLSLRRQKPLASQPEKKTIASHSRSCPAAVAVREGFPRRDHEDGLSEPEVGVGEGPEAAGRRPGVHTPLQLQEPARQPLEPRRQPVRPQRPHHHRSLPQAPHPLHSAGDFIPDS